MAPSAAAARLFNIAADRVLSPDQITSAAPMQGTSEANSVSGIAGRNRTALARIETMPIAESASDMKPGLGFGGRPPRSAASTKAPMANSKMRQGIRKKAALGSVLPTMIASASEAQPVMAMTVNGRPDFDASRISAGQNR